MDNFLKIEGNVERKKYSRKEVGKEKILEIIEQ